MSKHKKLTHTQVVAKLREQQGQRSLRQFAEELGISAPYLSDIYKGQRGIGPKILQSLGLTKTEQTTVTYSAS